MVYFLAVLLGYIMGSVSFAAAAGRAAGIDTSAHGSGNLGARNVLRTLGPEWALVVLAGDLGKGALSAAAGLALAGDTTGGVAGVLGAVLGHNYSMFMGGRGGKGIAAMAGGYLVLSPPAAAGGIAVAVATLALTRNVYVAAVATLLSVPLLTYLALGPGGPVAVSFLVALASLARHRRDLVRLLRGQREPTK